MRILGLDIGSKRIGIALSDELGITAQSYLSFEYKDQDNLLNKLKDIIDKEHIDEIVVGLPLNMDGSAGPKAKEAISFCENLKENFDIPIKLWDERMTTMEASRIMIKADLSRNKRKRKVDKLAAQIILQSYLNSLSNKNVQEKDIEK